MHTKQLAATALGLILLIVCLFLTQDGRSQEWVEPTLPQGMFALSNVATTKQSVLDPGQPAQSPQQEAMFWTQQRCFPNSPLRGPNYNPLKGDFSGQKGWINAMLEVPDGIEVDRKVMTLYRDVLRNAVRPLEIYAYVDGNPCGIEIPIWLSECTATAIWRLNMPDFNKMVWVTADHCVALEDYSDVDGVKVTVDGNDGIVLPRRSDFKYAMLVTEDIPHVVPLNDLLPQHYETYDRLFYPLPKVLVGQKMYIAYTTLANDCVPPIWAPAKCVVQWPQVNTGHVTSVLSFPGKLGGAFTLQADLMGGSSGSLAFVYQDNGDEFMNGADFRVVGITNAGWETGNTIMQEFRWPELYNVVQYLQKMNSIWD